MTAFDDAGPALGPAVCGSVSADAPRERPAATADLRAVALDASTTLMAAEPDEFDTKLRWGLRSVGEQLDVDRVAVYQSAGDGFERTHAWTASDADDWTTARIGPVERYDWLTDCLDGFDPVAVSHPGDLPAAATPVRALLRAEGVGSFLAVPLVVDWQLRGVVTFDTERVGRRWPDDVVTVLGEVAELFGHALARVRRERLLARQNERLETFAGVVTHDLRNPLSVVLAALDLARETGDDSYLDRALDASERMNDLIDGMLTLARRGDDIGETEPLDVGTVARRAWSSVETADAALSVVDAPAPVEGDPDRLRSAFENLFRNAVDHGGPAVAVEVGSLADRAGFYVEDDGDGFGDAEDVFEYGYSTDDTGTGFGLFTVRRVVEAHGWSVETVDAADGGARFEVAFAGPGVVPA
ncbi:GAF domain-containing sensor histidine kinase [Candidatus Halobonum tyrrellensis]|uniref:histidine kinase n=1 Tax=Candidatus Halobonum tyrrellensis G22 TaxID=1324957 RepID=V4HI24_9EURY|nr:HAMP domain-containing sensor histidine kinase [Candidatus Halobonum tyrrellensis]ESP87569.1 pas domain s-box [Candidatus Halobonum tyrrellensis G22]